MKHLINRQVVLVTALLSITLGTAEANNLINDVSSCYSAYQFEQDLTMSLRLSDSTQRQNINRKMTIHIRDTDTPLELIQQLKRLKNGTSENLRSYILLLSPKRQDSIGKDANNGHQKLSEAAYNYRHPFLATIDRRSGKLIDLVSTTQDKAKLKEYLGYFDLFQYSKTNGDFQYQNSNGQYRASIQAVSGSNGVIEKFNKGYLDNQKLSVNHSSTRMTLESSSSSSNCFFQSAVATEVFINRIAAGLYLKGDTEINIAIDNSLILPSAHFFHSLTSDLSLWPSFKQKTKLTQQQAFEKLNQTYNQLQLALDDKMAFLALLENEKATWPYLSEFMLQEKVSSEFINRVIWSLNRINSTDSVSSLLKVSMSELPDKNIYRSILTLITSSAEINQQGIDDLKRYLSDSRYSETSSDERLLLLRSLGAIAKHRAQHAPIQSAEIKQFLYDNVEGASTQFKASLYESIGALGNNIDQQGVDILMIGLSEPNSLVKNSALNALTKIPYQKEYSALYVNQLDSDLHSTTKNKLIQLLGKTDREDRLVKQKLLSIIESPSAYSLKRHSIASLKQIDFNYNAEEIKVLESRLRQETDKSSQTKLASLILKHRRP